MMFKKPKTGVYYNTETDYIYVLEVIEIICRGYTIYRVEYSKSTWTMSEYDFRQFVYEKYECLYLGEL